MDNSKTRAKILDSAKRLLAEQGFSDVSMQQIADEVKVTKAALYHFFPAKEDIYVAVMQDLLMAAQALTEDILSQDLPPREQFQKMVEGQLRFGMENRTILQFWDLAVMKIDEGKRAELCQQHRAFKGAIQKIFEHNELSDPQMGVMVMMSSILQYIKMGNKPFLPSPEVFSDYLSRLFLP